MRRSSSGVATRVISTNSAGTIFSISNPYVYVAVDFHRDLYRPVSATETAEGGTVRCKQLLGLHSPKTDQSLVDVYSTTLISALVTFLCGPNSTTRSLCFQSQ
jgi:hypothetical protein